MIITKGSIVYLYNNVPLTKDYTDTMYFASLSAQTSAFASLSHLNVSNYSYVGPGENTFRVDCSANTNENLYTYNYIAFQNTTFGGKWWYAFIDSVRYINNSCYEISYTIDVFQSFMFEVDWTTQVFVEREHSVLDEIFTSFTDENIDTGEYQYWNQTDMINPKNPEIVVASSVDSNNDDVKGSLYGNIYSGLAYNVFSTTDFADVNAFLSGLTDNNKSSAVVAIFMAYAPFFNSSDGSTAALTREVGITVRTDTIDNYQPRNKKLFNYPYNFLYITNGSGNSMNVEPQYCELNENGQQEFLLVGETSCNPTITLYPLGYKGTESGTANFNEKMTLTGFPQCAYTIDSFRAWLAQNSGTTAMQIVGGVGSIAGGIATTALSGGLASSVGAGMIATGAMSIGSSMIEIGVQSARPPQASGNSGSGGMFAQGLLTFMVYQCQITRERAMIIDSYFDKKGYAVKRVKQANRSSRPHWNYVETREADYHGAVPSEYLEQINTAMNHGVTFWKNFSDVGNYSLLNEPT